MQQAIAEIRRLTGLTWEQLGEILGVSRRSVHFWASGKSLSAANEQRLLRVLDIFRSADRGDATSTRAALLRVTGGKTPFQLLVEQKFDEAISLLGTGAGRRGRPKMTELSPAARAARAPRRPDELVDALPDPVHREVRSGRAAQTVRNKQRGSS
jgi:transcriptional regulator with XRE-family HTH domain